MTKSQMLGIVRHVATAAGAYLVVTGKADDALVQEAVGAFVAVASVIWSLYEKTTRS